MVNKSPACRLHGSMAAPEPMSQHAAQIRVLAGARPAIAAPTGKEELLLQSAWKIYSFMVSTETARQNKLPALPNFESMLWFRVYQHQAGENSGLMRSKWSPRCMDNRGTSPWFFTILPSFGNSGEAGCGRRVSRVIVDSSPATSWHSDHGRKRNNKYPHTLMLNSLRTKAKIDNKLYHMKEITLSCEENTQVALCIIKEASPSSKDNQAATTDQSKKVDDIITTEATNMETHQPHEDSYKNTLDGGNFSNQVNVVPDKGISMGEMGNNLTSNFLEDGPYILTVESFYNSDGNTGSDLDWNVEVAGADDIIITEATNMEMDQPHEGISNGATEHDVTIKFLKDISYILANKELFAHICNSDCNTGAVVAFHVENAASLMRNFLGRPFDVSEFLNDEPV